MRRLNQPWPGRNHRTGPKRTSSSCVCRSWRSNSAAERRALGASDSMWLPSSCPSLIRRCTTSSLPATCSPIMKKDEWARVRLLEQDVRESPAEPADDRTGSKQGRDDDGEQPKKVRDSLTHNQG